MNTQHKSIISKDYFVVKKNETQICMANSKLKISPHTTLIFNQTKSEFEIIFESAADRY